LLFNAAFCRREQSLSLNLERAMGIEPNPNLETAWIQSLSANRAIADVESSTDRLRAKQAVLSFSIIPSLS
jgi:hypothetical protein